MTAIRYVPFAGRLLIGLPFAMSRPEPNDSFPQERHDGRRVAANRRVRRRRNQHRQP